MRPWIIWYAIFLHGLWGVIFLISGVPYTTTATAELHLIIPNVYILGLLLLLITLAAIWSLLRPRGGKVNILLLLPQQFLLMVSAGGALLAILNGQFADGVQRDRFFIFIDQAPAILATIMHTCAVLNHFAPPTTRDRIVT